MKTWTRLENLDRLSLWQQPSGNFRARQPLLFAKSIAINLSEPSGQLRLLGQAKQLRLSGQSGQIVLEYVLLLVVAVGIAAAITKGMIGSDVNNPGFVTATWFKVIQAIGADHADDIQRGK